MNNDKSLEHNEIFGEHSYSSVQFKPLYLQHIESSLCLNKLISSSKTLVNITDDSEDELKQEDAAFLKNFKPSKFQSRRERGRPISNSFILLDPTEKKLTRQSVYCTSHLKYKKKWLRDLLLSDSESSEEDDDHDDFEQPITEAQLKRMLQEHVQLKKYRNMFPSLSNKTEFKDYTYGILGQGNFPEPINDKVVRKKGAGNSANSKSNSLGIAGASKGKDEDLEDGELLLPYGVDLEQFCSGENQSASATSQTTPQPQTKSGKQKKVITAEVLLARRKKLWHSIVKKDIAKAAKARSNFKKEQITNARKCAVAIMKQKRKEALASQKAMTSLQTRMKRICRDVAIYWKRFEKVERQQMKKVQKEAQEQRKQDLNLLEAKRQARKLNFLITQTELYAHFMAKKITGGSEEEQKSILNRLDETNELKLHSSVLDDYDVDEVKNRIVSNVELAYHKQSAKTTKFDASVAANIDGNMGLSTPEMSGHEYPQPSIFVGKLKSYQIKGMNWLANLYSQGINGILADEMGLGKTVQSIAFLAHLAEVHGIWGPFLVIAPASTLHNWQQECSRFVPKMRVVPYWGTTHERKILRKFWDQQNLHTEHASFHIVITSYQLVIQDCKYFSKVHWHYMVLDEAQALKSSSSTRWKTLLSFHCRNRLLLTGTPIQNSMAELWALLHFIMPTLFDSHDEFNEWFSKDIENHVENRGNIDQNHLSRLHMILKPFMLRRIKRDVENDLTDKIEILVYCPLTIRQRYLYDAIKKKIRIEDLLAGVSQSSAATSSSATSSLMNLVMQFRKVCNHPELFERRDVKSPAYVCLDPYLIPKLVYREGLLDQSLPSKQHILQNLLNVHTHVYTHQSANTTSISESGNLFSWMKLANMSSNEHHQIMLTGLYAIMSHAIKVLKERRQLHYMKQLDGTNSSYVRRRLLLIEDELCTDFTHTEFSPVLSDLVFTSYTSHFHSHLTQSFYYMKETPAHKKIRMRNKTEVSEAPPPTSPIKKRHTKFSNKVQSPPPINNNIDVITEGEKSIKELGSYHCDDEKLLSVLHLQPVDMPAFLTHMIPKAQCPPLELYCHDRSAEYDKVRRDHCGTLEAKDLIRFGAEPSRSTSWLPCTLGGLQAIDPPYGFSSVYIPDKRSMIVDAGKMHVLDDLLTKLKKEGHRVLIYSTMTKVIDLLEEFMWYRKHQYMRLDGSSKISDRRDMVSDFQSKTDIFVFLLSTRAGGLGINLTAADTVIFYDSDWNPTVDAQAMDRAHRLGQTKQVTVYRLICKGTIEERILERAKEKSEIQRMVISGHNNFKPDVLKPKEVVSLLIDDDSLKQKIEQAHANKADRAEKRKLTSTKKTEDSSAPKAKRGRRSTKKTSETTSPSTTPCNTPQSLTGTLVKINNGSASLGADEDSLDVDTIDGASSRASSPAVSSTPSTPSIQPNTPVSSVSGKRRGRPKGSTNSGKSLRGKTSAASLKKALTAAEIAGTKAGMNAAYAAYGITKPTGSSPVLKPVKQT